MDMESIEEEITTNGNRKINIGVRCYSELKIKLVAEAMNLGITLSEYCENIFLNKDNILSENQNYINEIAALNQVIAEVKKAYEEATSKHLTVLKEVKSENANLKNEVDILKDQVILFTDKQLLFLFEKIKGQKDVIDTPDGRKRTVVYNSPKDLLEAMIYSFICKKP